MTEPTRNTDECCYATYLLTLSVIAALPFALSLHHPHELNYELKLLHPAMPTAHSHSEDHHYLLTYQTSSTSYITSINQYF
jgi:hypothetical protein